MFLINLLRTTQPSHLHFKSLANLLLLPRHFIVKRFTCTCTYTYTCTCTCTCTSTSTMQVTVWPGTGTVEPR